MKIRICMSNGEKHAYEAAGFNTIGQFIHSLFPESGVPTWLQLSPEKYIQVNQICTIEYIREEENKKWEEWY